MSQARWISRDEIEVPMTAEGSDDLVGESLVVIGPGHKTFQVWADWLNESGEKRPK